MSMLIFLIAVWDYSYNFASEFIYDNSIFAYSSADINDFINQTHPYRYPFESIDDLVSSAKLDLLLRNKFFSKKTTTFNFGFALHHYLTNNQKDSQRIDFGLRQAIGNFAVKLSYQIIPSYLIRYYLNPKNQINEYIGCEVKYQTLYGKISFIPCPDIKLDFQYGRKWEDYISAFNQYDCNGHLIETGAELKLTNRIDWAFGYALKMMQSDSADISTPGNEAVPDGSYYQHSLRSMFTYQFKFFLPSKLKFGYTFDFKNFTTDFAADSMHYGRRDYMHNLLLDLELKIFTGMFMAISYYQQWRYATSMILPDINTTKDYNKYRLGMGLNFYY